MTWRDPDTIRKALDMLAEGRATSDVAAVVGASECTVRAWRRRNTADPSWPPPAVPCTAKVHDTMNAYSRGCRCPAAKAAKTAWKRRYDKDLILGRGMRLVPATATRRRVYGLHALGWRTTDIAEAAGLNPNSIAGLYRGEKVTTATDKAVERAARELLRRGAGPSPRTAKRARRLGHIPLHAWDDDTIGDPTALPQGVGYQLPASRYKTRLPDARVLAGEINDASLRAVAARYGVDHKTVHKRLERAGYVNVAPAGKPSVYRKQEAA